MSEKQLNLELAKEMNLSAYRLPATIGGRMLFKGETEITDAELLEEVSDLLGYVVVKGKTPKVKAKAATGAKRGRKPKAQAPEPPPVELPAQ
ncbi:MAG: hypothetical protein V1755_14140 [Chloroflexota bacterium]